MFLKKCGSTKTLLRSPVRTSLLILLLKKGANLAPLFLSVSFVFLPWQLALGWEEPTSLRKTLSVARELNLANHPTWSSLLHFRNGNCSIEDTSFLLSGTSCSLDSELAETIKLFYASFKGNNHPACRFPARRAFIQRGLLSKGFSLPNIDCPNLEEYLTKAPAESVSLVFASENVSQPSSMLGHVFLKLSGTTDLGVSVDHAVSYFTRIDTANVPRLILESMFFGMTSYYALTPYAEQLKLYLQTEGRNVWEYQLHLSEEERELIHLHIWELKDVKSKYLFAGYNCATVVYFILSIAEPDFLEKWRFWITPLDVAKQAKLSGLIRNTRLIPSDKWKIKMISNELSSQQQSEVYHSVRSYDSELVSDTNDEDLRYLQLELARTYSDYRLNSGAISGKNYQKLQKLYPVDEKRTIDVSNYKDPLKRPEDSQVSVGYYFRDNRSFLRLNILPTSHKLSDDNRQLFSESSLELGDTTLLFELDNSSLSLQEFKLFSAASIIPRDNFTGGISGRFGIGVEEHLDESLDTYRAGHVSGGVGLAKSIHENVVVYSLLNTGLGYGNSNAYLYGSPEIGVYVNEIYGLKGVGTYEFVCGQNGDFPCYQRLRFSETVPISSDYALKLGFVHEYRSSEDRQSFEIMLTRYF